MSLEPIEDVPPESAAEDIPLPFPYYTIFILLCMSVVFGAQLLTGLERSIKIGGFVKPWFVEYGEYWRILTGTAVHGSVLHVVLNGYALYNFGRLMELLSNRAHLAIVFVLAAVGGNVLSLLFFPEGNSVGASGGIVGLLGYLLVYAFRRRQFVSAEFRKSLIINTGFILIFGLVLFQVIDNYGHIGGLLTGIVYGIFQIPSDAYENPQNANGVTKLIGAIAIGTYAVTCLFTILRLSSAV